MKLYVVIAQESEPYRTAEGREMRGPIHMAAACEDACDALEFAGDETRKTWILKIEVKHGVDMGCARGLKPWAKGCPKWEEIDRHGN